MNIHHNLEVITAVALDHTKEDGYNYNIILHNPNDKGEFDIETGSTYEFVMDSYFNTPRPNVILLHKTKDLLQEKQVDSLISGIMKDAEKLAKMQKEINESEAEMHDLESKVGGNKLKKGLTIVKAQADGLIYKQGRDGLERINNTNRNDKCNCGSGRKFKKCCGK
jgi:uncharacterized protein YecA (UPF0149 family)